MSILNMAGRICLKLVVMFMLICAFAVPAFAQTCITPPLGVIAWWPLDETSGRIAQDIVGTHPSVYFGGPTPVAGVAEGALHFNGSDFIGAGDSDLWAFGASDFTIELWANFDRPGSGDIGHPGNIFIGNDEGPSNRNKWFFALGAGYLNFHINSPSIGPKFFPLVPFLPVVGQWYHLAITRNGNIYTIFVNGTPRGSAVNADDIPNPSAFLTIGQAENLGFMNGLLDEVTIYNRALTQAEIAEIANAGSAGKCKKSPGGSVQITSLTPMSGGNAGDTTVSIMGSGFAPGAVVNLVEGGTPILTGNNTVVISPTAIRTTFNLRGELPRDVKVQVENPDGTAVLASDPFTILNGGKGQLELQIIGPGTVRVGRNATFFILLSNIGTNDIRLASVSAGFQWNGLPLELQFPELPFSVVPVPTGGPPVSIPIQIPFPLTLQGCGSFNASAEPDDKEPEEMDCEELTEEISRILKEIDKVTWSIAVVDMAIRELRCNDPPPENIKKCEDERAALERLQENLEGLNEYLGELLAERARRCENIEGGSAQTTMTAALLSTAQADQSQAICAVNSWDPNDKIGPVGAGSPRYLPAQSLLPYTIFFENLQTATGPAQEVSINDQLNLNLDWMTVSFDTIRFGSVVLHPTLGQRHFTTSIDLRPAKNLLLAINADLNSKTGMVTWRFTSHDPNTGQLPTDPHVGFLPANVKPPEGEGSVSFTVMPKERLPVGTEVHNKASIVFDTNPAIDTPEVFNTIDSSSPISQVLPLAPTQSSTDFAVQWSGTDEGAGIRDYNLFVSENERPFKLWLKDTTNISGIFHGKIGSSYAFYSIARDQAGNVEMAPPKPDTTTAVAADTMPPVITVSASPSLLWPPNGNMVSVRIVGTITDSGSGVNSSTAVYNITDEYGSMQPSGSVTLGSEGNFSFMISLQAARNGNDKTGRQYTVTVSVQDKAGNKGFSSALVTVPHDQRK